jgi:hypothetical protein
VKEESEPESCGNNELEVRRGNFNFSDAEDESPSVIAESKIYLKDSQAKTLDKRLDEGFLPL